MDNKTYLLNNRAYEILKWAGLIAFPAIATFIGVIGAVWGWHDTDAIVTTLNAIGVLIGALIGVSHATAKTNDSTTK
nr:MAG TPA: holin [Caudoviricetes sp.]